jgi:acyl-CoA thioesterase-1
MNKKKISISLFVLLAIGTAVWFETVHAPVELKKEGSFVDESVNPNTQTIIAFGDSLTAGYGVTAKEAYPAQLEKALQEKGYVVTVINAGVSGETTRGNLERAPFIRAQNADVVLLGIGGNDALRNLPLSETRKNMQETIDILTEGDDAPVVLLLQMQAPLNGGFQYKKEFDSLYEKLASENNLRLVPFITARLFLDSKYKLSDGIHYNQYGYQRIIQEYVLPETEKALR